MTNSFAPSQEQEQMLRTARKFVADERLADAEAAYRGIIDAAPTCHPAYHGLGLLAFRIDKLEIAADLMASAIALDASIALYHRDRGEICRRLGRFDEAVRNATDAVQIAPNDADSHYNLGLAFAAKENYAAAAQSYRRTVELEPTHGRALNNLGSVLEKLDDKSAAEAAYRAAIAIDERHAEAQNNLGTLLSQTGAIDAARSCLEKALAVDPALVTSHYGLSALKRYRSDDPAVQILESMNERTDKLPLLDRTRLLFTLGKMRDDLEQFDRAFEAFAEGNRLHATTIRFNEVRVHEQAANIIRRCDHALLESNQGHGNPDPTAVFIVGMPRSGTTLTEQILASHRDVFGAGELKTLHDVVGEVAGPSKQAPFPQVMATLPAESLRTVGDRYLESIRKLAPHAVRIVDKMPGNFHYLGLIKLALPNARIIHVMRDPMDTCLSCYTHLFSDAMDFAYDLGTLGRYYVRYMKLMEHWRRVLPEDFVLDVRYEYLVADIESQTRRMLAHIGLPWDDNCLKFYDNARPVRTASLAQVRKPIYSSSVAGWRRFERQLAPLLEIVRDYRE
jgi:tetratricopeptide (TPR) repeat protein